MRENGHILVVVQSEEAYKGRKTGGNKEAPPAYLHEQTTGGAHRVDRTMANVNSAYRRGMYR